LKRHDLFANRCNLIADTRFILTADTRRFILTPVFLFFFIHQGPRGTVDARAWQQQMNARTLGKPSNVEISFKKMKFHYLAVSGIIWSDVLRKLH
jgi:hypothetical protein